MRRNIFIASSAELRTERLELVDLLLDLNNDTKNVGIQFKPVVWEFMDSSMQEGRKEDLRWYPTHPQLRPHTSCKAKRITYLKFFFK